MKAKTSFSKVSQGKKSNVFEKKTYLYKFIPNIQYIYCINKIIIFSEKNKMKNNS
jgi:hypothetical protein